MDARELLAKVRKIEIRTRRTVDELTAGAYHSVFKGKGIEFDEVREYVPGDEVRDIDWNVTARMNAPYVKKYVEERELSVFLLVDVSASGDFGTKQQSKKQLATELASLLAFSAIRNNDRVGLMLFSTTEELHLRPKKGRRHGLRLVRELLACERKHPGTNIRQALESLMRADYRRGVVFLISDFIDDGYSKALRVAGMKHDLIAVRLMDPCDTEFAPVGLVQLEDAETGAGTLFSATAGNRQTYTETATAMHERTRELIVRAGVDLINIHTDQEYLGPIMHFFKTRERRRRME